MPQTYGIGLSPVIRALDKLIYGLRTIDSWLDEKFPYFWHHARLQKDAPLHHRFETIEYDYPFRTALSHIVRLPGTGAGVVFGRWENERLDEDAAQLQATQGHGLASSGSAVRMDGGPWARLIRVQQNNDGESCLLVELADGQKDLWLFSGDAQFDFADADVMA